MLKFSTLTRRTNLHKPPTRPEPPVDPSRWQQRSCTYKVTYNCWKPSSAAWSSQEHGHSKRADTENEGHKEHVWNRLGDVVNMAGRSIETPAEFCTLVLSETSRTNWYDIFVCHTVLRQRARHVRSIHVERLNARIVPSLLSITVTWDQRLWAWDC